MLEKIVKGEPDWGEKVNANFEKIKSYLRGSNNLLLNANFRANQLCTHTMFKTTKKRYYIDQWYYYGGDIKIDNYKKLSSDEGIVLKNETESDQQFVLGQYIDFNLYEKELFDNAKMTFICELEGKLSVASASKNGLFNGNGKSSMAYYDYINDESVSGKYKHTFTAKVYEKTKALEVGLRFTLPPGKSIKIKNCVLAFGEETPIYQGRSYAEDIALCKMYYEMMPVLNMDYLNTSAYYKVHVPYSIAKLGGGTTNVYSDMKFDGLQMLPHEAGGYLNKITNLASGLTVLGTRSVTAATSGLAFAEILCDTYSSTTYGEYFFVEYDGRIYSEI